MNAGSATSPPHRWDESSDRFLRPIKLSIAISMFGELVIFVVWGIVLYPEGSILNKLLWTVFFCGLGMGGALGSLIALFIVDRLRPALAIAATTLLAVLLLGVGCNLLCLHLDRHFLYFGGAENGALFIWNGVAMAALGGLAVGWLSPKSSEPEAAHVARWRQRRAGDRRPCRSASGRCVSVCGAWGGSFRGDEVGRATSASPMLTWRPMG